MTPNLSSIDENIWDESNCRSTARKIAENLKGTIAAFQAFSRLADFKPRKTWPDLKAEFAAVDAMQDAVRGLVEATSTDAGRRVVLTSLRNHPSALTTLLIFVQVSLLLLLQGINCRMSSPTWLKYFKVYSGCRVTYELVVLQRNQPLFSS